MDFEKVISERYSVRKFESNHIEQELIDKILHAGHIAPTVCNFHPQRILVLNNDETILKLKNCTKCHFDAPCAMLVCYNSDETWTRPYDGALSAPVDASIVATHMMLEATNLGLGSCWVMHFDPAAIKAEFNIPENIIPHALLVMGYPHQSAAPLDMHLKVRPLDETVFYDSF